MKYLLFSGQTYYPSGGFEDFMGSFESIEDAKEYMNSYDHNWAQIVDLETMKIVLYGHRPWTLRNEKTKWTYQEEK